MLPLKDRNPTERVAILTIALIAVNVAAFLLWQDPFPTDERARDDQAIFYFCHGLVPWEVTNQTPLAEGGSEALAALRADFGPDAEVILDGFGDFQGVADRCPDKNVWLSVLTSMFMHGGLLHIAGNMLFLWVFGNNVEDKAGFVRYLIFYFVCGVAAAAAHVGSGPGSTIPTVGASGAIGGVLGAYLVMFPRRRVLTLLMFYFITTVELPAYVLLGFWFALQWIPILQEIGGAGAGVTDVAVWAHIGGFAAGAAIAFLMFPREKGDPHAWERRPII